MLHSHRPVPITKDALAKIHGLAEDARPGHIYLLTGENRLVGGIAQELVDRLALRGEVYVIVGGNRFSMERLPLLLSRQPHLLEQALQRIRITRAETCYQLLDALEHTYPYQCPLVVTDILSSLTDDDIDDAEAARLLAACIHNLHRLSEFEPVLVSAALPPRRPHLLETLQIHVSDQVRFLEPSRIEGGLPQPALFQDL